MTPRASRGGDGHARDTSIDVAREMSRRAVGVLARATSTRARGVSTRDGWRKIHRAVATARDGERAVDARARSRRAVGANARAVLTRHIATPSVDHGVRLEQGRDDARARGRPRVVRGADDDRGRDGGGEDGDGGARGGIRRGPAAPGARAKARERTRARDARERARDAERVGRGGDTRHDGRGVERGERGGDEGGRASERKDDTEAETGGTATRRVGEVEVAEKERAQTGAGEAETGGGAGDDGTRRAARGGASEELKVGGQGPVLERPERREIPKNMLIT